MTVKQALACLAFVVLGGCGHYMSSPLELVHDCPEGKTLCHGNDRMSCAKPLISFCALDAHPRWSREPCGDGFCREVDGDVFCAVEPRPNPVCPGPESGRESGGACESETSLVKCTRGYVTRRVACVKCDDEDCTGQSGAPCGSDADCSRGLACLPFPSVDAEDRPVTAFGCSDPEPRP
jgi:hypothetical protein